MPLGSVIVPNKLPPSFAINVAPNSTNRATGLTQPVIPSLLLVTIFLAILTNPLLNCSILIYDYFSPILWEDSFRVNKNQQTNCNWRVAR